MYILYILGTMIFCILSVQCAEQGILKSINEQVLDIVVANCSRFSHEDLMALGILCKSNDTYLRETSKKRKNYFLICMPMIETRYNSFQWHGYGSRADRKKIVNDDFSILTKKTLILERVELSYNGKIHSYYGNWSNFESELSYKPVPFYDADKQLCFFGVGWENVPGYGKCGNVIRYSTRLKRDIMDIKNTQAIRCILCCCSFINNNKEALCTIIDSYLNRIALCPMLEFPHLLKSILMHTSVEKRILPDDIKDDCYLLYHSKDIVIPDNYKEFVQHESKITYKTFDMLPKELKIAITEQYEKKNLHGSRED